MTDYKKTGRDRGDGCDAQRVRLLAAMREAGHVTTTEARLFLEIMNPAQRICELRDQGAEIDTAWTLEPSEAGRDPHRQARYVLIPNQGGTIAAELAGLILLALVAGLLLGGVLR